MHEGVFCSQRRGDSGLVASELSTGGMPRARGPGRFKRPRLVLLVLGCVLLNFACANDSDDDQPQQRHHRHGNGQGRDQNQTNDRSDNPSPTPAFGL